MKLSKPNIIIIVLFTLIVLAFLGLYLYKERLQYTVVAFSHTPQNVRITNVTDKGFTVTWKTDEPTRGYVIYEKGDNISTSTYLKGKHYAIDDRDFYSQENNPSYQFEETDVVEGANLISENLIPTEDHGQYYTHHVTVRNLDPQSKYSFLISDGSAFGFEDEWIADDEYNYSKSNSVITLNTQNDFFSPHPAYGTVESEFVDVVPEGISFVNIQYQDGVEDEDSFIPISSPISSEGVWYIDVSSIRSNDSSITQFDPENHFVRLFIDAGPHGRSMNNNIPPYEDSPAKPIQVSSILPEGYDEKTQAYNYEKVGAQVAGLGDENNDPGYSDPTGVIDNNCTGTGGSIGKCAQNHQDGYYYTCTEGGWQRVDSCGGAPGGQTAPGGGTDSNPGAGLYSGSPPSGDPYADYDWGQGPPKEFFYNPDISNYSGPPPGTSDFYYQLDQQNDPNTWGFNGVENARNGGPGAGCSKGRSCAPGLQCIKCPEDSWEHQKAVTLLHDGVELCMDPSRDITLMCGGFRRTLDTTPFNYHDDPVETPWWWSDMAVHCPSDEIAKQLMDKCTDNYYNNRNLCIEECHALNDGCQSTAGRMVISCCKANTMTTDPMCDPSHFLYCPEACPNGNPFPEQMRAPYSQESIQWQQENNVNIREGGTGLGGRIPSPNYGDWQPEELASILSRYNNDNGYEDVGFTTSNQSSSLWQQLFRRVSANEEIILEPKEGIVFVEKAGKYCIEDQGLTYCAQILNPGRVKLFIDSNENGSYDEGERLLTNSSGDYVAIDKVEEYFQRSLVRGINLVSLNVIKEDGTQYTASELLEKVNEMEEEALYSIATYDNTLGKWLIVGSNHGNTFKGIDFNIVPGKGYLIKSQKTFSFTIDDSDQVELDTVYLGTGWNLISIPNKNFKDSEKPSELLQTIHQFFNEEVKPDNFSQWNRSVSKYEGVAVEYSENSQSIFGRDFAINDQAAYFVRVKDGSGSWTY